PPAKRPESKVDHYRQCDRALNRPWNTGLRSRPVEQEAPELDEQLLRLPRKMAASTSSARAKKPRTEKRALNRMRFIGVPPWCYGRNRLNHAAASSVRLAIFLKVAGSVSSISFCARSRSGIGTLSFG